MPKQLISITPLPQNLIGIKTDYIKSISTKLKFSSTNALE